MRPDFFRAGWARGGLFGLWLSAVFCASPVLSEPRHGLSMYGDPALPQDFVSLPYTNPAAPKGGRIVVGNTGGFDSLNPFILKGTVPWQLRFLGYESLMGRNYDEPFALYGLLAESVETGPNREWVEFTLRPEARFSDGSPVTLDDVLWSYEILGTLGPPALPRLLAKGRKDRTDRPALAAPHLQHCRPRTGADRRPAPNPAKGPVGGPRLHRLGPRGSDWHRSLCGRPA